MTKNLKQIQLYVNVHIIINMFLYLVVCIIFMYLSYQFIELADIGKVSEYTENYLYITHLSSSLFVYSGVCMFALISEVLSMVGIYFRMLSWLLYSSMVPYIVFAYFSVFLQGKIKLLSYDHNYKYEAPVMLHLFNDAQKIRMFDFLGISLGNSVNDRVEQTRAIAKFIQVEAVVEFGFLIILTVKELWYLSLGAKLGYYFLKIK